MKIKAYHSNSVEAAIRQARAELGAEAILLDSKKSDPSERHLGLYEVRFVISGPGRAEPAGGSNRAIGSPAQQHGQRPREVEQAFRRAVWSGPARALPGHTAPSREPVATDAAPSPTAPRERGEPAPAATPAAGPTRTTDSGSLGEISRGIEELRRMLHSYTQTCYLPAGELAAQPLLARLYQDLAANEVSPELAAQLVASLTPAAERGAGRAELERDLREKIEALVPVAPEMGTNRGAMPQIVALVGPTGAGKTTTLAKLAGRLGLEKRRRVHLLSADNHRIGAFHQIETYAEIFGVGYTAVDEIEELAAVLADFHPCFVGQSQAAQNQAAQNQAAQNQAGQDETGPNRAGQDGSGQSDAGVPDLVLIDTPGYGASEIEGAAALAGLLRAGERIDTHLVLSASTKPKDLLRSIEEYTVFGPGELLFTKLDETQTFGPLFNEAVRTGWPLSFLGVGQRIPEDLLPAGQALVAELVWSGRLHPPRF